MSDHVSSCQTVFPFSHLKIIAKYLKATNSSPQIVNVWVVDRETEVGIGLNQVYCDIGD